ncbi:hypothetical protein HG531_001273 [Fusarium graminearum]|nr:hypothetical protein HG531_001273 [Fusarium graminearum]
MGIESDIPRRGGEVAGVVPVAASVGATRRAAAAASASATGGASTTVMRTVTVVISSQEATLAILAITFVELVQNQMAGIGVAGSAGTRSNRTVPLLGLAGILVGGHLVDSHLAVGHTAGGFADILLAGSHPAHYGVHRRPEGREPAAGIRCCGRSESLCPHIE